MANEESKCGCVCHKMAGIFIILIGLTFLLGSLGVLGSKAVSVIWPIIVIVAGIKCLMKGACKCCKEG